MSTHDVERELTTLLHRHAEDAMTDTDTPSELETFQRSVEERGPDRRRLLAAGATAAAAAAAIVAVAVWAADPDADRSQPAPATPGGDTSADREVAEGFVDAFADHDVPAATEYLAEDTEAWPDWTSGARRDAAWNVIYLVDQCHETATSSAAGVVFNCPYDLHLLASDQVGLGPYPDNHFEVVVRDGEVTGATSVIPFETNGVGNHVEEVTRWVRKHHPADADFLLKEEQAVTEAEWPRWTRLWHQYLEEYVDAGSAGGSS